MASRAIPSHLRPSAAAAGGPDGGAERKHHGKSQSHVVSTALLSFPSRMTWRPSQDGPRRCGQTSIPTLQLQVAVLSSSPHWKTDNETALALCTLHEPEVSGLWKERASSTDASNGSYGDDGFTFVVPVV
jgi:hypothetical protein